MPQNLSEPATGFGIHSTTVDVKTNIVEASHNKKTYSNNPNEAPFRRTRPMPTFRIGRTTVRPLTMRMAGFGSGRR